MIGVDSESWLMRLLKKAGLNRLAWSVRRLHCPVTREALVLDVGSGGNPYPRANVLLDAYEDTPERFYLPLIKDRPMVLGAAEQMPFRDNAFDFVIASHILEHTSEPEQFISELMRVSKAGYIETPDGFFERINPYRFHRLEVSLKDGSLRIFKKPSWRHESYLVDMYENQLKCEKFIAFTSNCPDPFYVRYYWNESINYSVINPDTDADWPLPEVEYSTDKVGVRSYIVSIVRSLFSQRSRNAKLNLSELIACPTCRSADLNVTGELIACKSCGQTYPVRNGIPVMYPCKQS